MRWRWPAGGVTDIGKQLLLFEFDNKMQQETMLGQQVTYILELRNKSTFLSNE